MTARAQLPRGPRAQLAERLRQDRLRRRPPPPDDATPADTDLGEQTCADGRRTRPDEPTEADAASDAAPGPGIDAGRRQALTTRLTTRPDDPPPLRCSGGGVVCEYRGDHESRRPLRRIPRVPRSSRPAASSSAWRSATARCPIERKPEWIKTRLKTGPEYTELKSLVRREGLHTVCEEAGCPNIYECWEDREATFLIGGDQCTRRCDFCQIDTGKPAEFDADEPRRVAESVATMGLQVRHGHRRRPRRPARRRRLAVRRDGRARSTPSSPAAASSC